MRGTFAPPAEHYSKELKDLILTLLQLDPDMRPNANQIMAKPIVINTTLSLLDIGSLQCKRYKSNIVHEPLKNLMNSTLVPHPTINYKFVNYLISISGYKQGSNN